MFVGSGRFDPSVPHSHVSISDQREYRFPKNTSPSWRVYLGVITLLNSAPLLESLVVSSFGPFKALGRDTHRNENPMCGIFEEHKNLGFWSGFDMLSAVQNAITSYKETTHSSNKNRISVTVEHDMNTSGLGEHYYYFDRHYHGDPLLRAKYLNRTTAYVKISNTVNVGVVSNGSILNGCHQPQYNHFRPSKNFMGITDQFNGCCDIHADSIEGLTSVHALEARSGMSWQNIPLNDTCWDFAAVYIAELCFHLITSLSPMRVSIGGKVAKGSAEYEAGWEPFIRKIRHQLQAKLGQISYKPEVSLYAEIHDLDNYLTYRKSKYPGLFGGLIMALNQIENVRNSMGVTNLRGVI